MTKDQPTTPHPPQFDPAATEFADLTLAFDGFFRWGATGVARLVGRRFLRCNLAGPALVALAGADNSFVDTIFSGCSFVVAPEDAPLQGVVRLEDCHFEDCILTRWVLFLPPALAAALARDMPEARLLGLPGLAC